MNYFILYIDSEPFRAAFKRLNEQISEDMKQLKIEAEMLAATATPFSLADELEKLAEEFKERQPIPEDSHRKKGKQIKPWNKTKFYQK